MDCCYCLNSILDTTRLTPVVLTHFIIRIAISLAFFLSLLLPPQPCQADVQRRVLFLTLDLEFVEHSFFCRWARMNFHGNSDV